MFAFFCANISIKVYFPKKGWTISRIADCRLQLYYIVGWTLFHCIFICSSPKPKHFNIYLWKRPSDSFLYLHTSTAIGAKKQQFYWITASFFSCLIYCNRETVRLKTDLGENHTYHWAAAPKIFSTENSLELLSYSKRYYNIPMIWE